MKMILGGGRKAGLIYIWECDNQKDWKNEGQFRAHAKPISRVARMNEFFITTSLQECEIKFWEFNSYQLCYQIREQNPICSLAVDPIKSYLYVGVFDKYSGKGKVNLWNSQTRLFI